MKKPIFLMVMVFTFVVEAVICVINVNSIENVRQDTVAVNACLYSVQNNYGQTALYDNSLAYTLLDTYGQVLYQNREGLSGSVNEAIKNNDTILDVVVNNEIVGKMLLHNTMEERIHAYKQRLIISLVSVTFVQMLLILIYYYYLKKNITDPFKKMNEFAYRVAGGDLDIPLTMDQGNVFGNFTEAFDLMRSELKRAKIAEKKANDDKKEMIAKLSHDIKTPVASIKSTSEIGYEIATEDRTKEFFTRINEKSDQLTALVDNLFTASVQDATEIAVNPSRYSSIELVEMIRNADYLNRCENTVDKLVGNGERVATWLVPECSIYMDKLRMQQVLDNIFTNSYKYANTPVRVEVNQIEEYLVIKIADYGAGVKQEELPMLKEKYKRGSNGTEKDGAGLGLYLADYFMVKMNGKLGLHNEEPGFAAIIYIRRV